MGNTNRTKGHALERYIARVFRGFGFSFCKTTRESSKLLDNCGVDLSFIPLLIQAKSGYLKNYPKYPVEYNKIKEALKQNFPEDHDIHKRPIVLVHRIDLFGKSHPENLYWSFSDDFAKKLLKKYYEDEKELNNIIKV